MMKTRVLIVLVFLAALYSCQEETQVNLISIQLFDDCITPIPGAEVALKSNVAGSFNSSIILGSGVSDANGLLNFTYELDEDATGAGDILLILPQGFETLLSSIELNRDQQYILYRRDLSTVEISFTGTRVFTLNDTLFYGFASTNETFSIVEPNAVQADTVSILSAVQNRDDVAETLCFGIGKEDFLKSKEAASIQDSVYNNVSVTVSGCGSFSQATIDLD